MSATRLMVIIFGIILIGGAITGIVASGFGYEVQDDTWAEPIADMVGFLIDLVNYAVQGITFIFQAIGGLFGGASGEYIEINGTGFSNGETLDGKYYLVNGSGNYVLSGGLFSSTKINTVRSGGTVDEATINSGKFGVFIKTIYNSTSVNNANERWYENWQKVDTSSNTANLSNTATGQEFTVSAPTTAVEEVQNFFGNVTNETKHSIRTVGVLPEVIGYPIMIFFFIAIVIGIIKLFPWT